MSATAGYSVDDYCVALRPITDRARQDRCAYKNRKGKTGWANSPLTSARIREHLVGKLGCGVGFITPGCNTTQLALLDLDSHNGEVPFDEMATVASSLCTQLDSIGLHPTVFRSSGGSGIHVWMIWDSPQDAYSVRQALIGVLSVQGFCDGTAGVACHEIEIFPKQNEVSLGRDGNMAVLPYWNRSELLVDAFGLCFESAGRVAGGNLVWRTSGPVPYVENTRPPQTVEYGAAPDSIEKISRALAAKQGADSGHYPVRG